MSGRARVTLSNGRRVIGYRKTLRQQRPRTPAHLLPDWHLTFILPHDMQFMGLTLGRVEGLIGVRLEPGVCLITGKNREWLLGQAVAFVRKVAPDFEGTVSIVLSRDSEAGVTLSGPLHSPIRGEGRIRIGRYDSSVLFGTSERKLVAAGGSR